MKALVCRSIEDETGDRCVDILRTGGVFGYVECRRDPEDSHGWRRIGPVIDGFGDEGAATRAARASIGWMEAA